MIKPLRHNQSGDTIIEVLICIAVVSLVLAGAYVSTNRNTLLTLDAQEHGQALKLVETQLEFLRAAAQPNPAFSLGVNNCFDNTGTLQVDNSHAGSDPCWQQTDGTSAPAGQEPTYKMKVVLSSAPNTYKVSATWDTPVGTAKDDGNVTMYYRPN